MNKLTRILLVAAIVAIPMSAFAGVEANGVRLNGVKFNGVKFNGVKFNGVKFNGVKVNGVKANGADLTGAERGAPVLKGVHAERGRLTR